MTDQHSRKLARWFEHAKAKGIKKSYYQPPVDILLQRFNVERPPMVFWPFVGAAFTMGSVFGILWGTLMYFMSWNKTQMPVSSMLAATVAAGALFGIMMSWLYRRARKRHGLTSWSAF